MLLIIRTFLFGLVYLPLVPVLLLLNVEFDTSVPVEKALYRLVHSAWPHLKSLVGHSFHYLMVSVFLGTTAGIVAGVNISITSRIFLLTKRHVKKEKARDPEIPATYSSHFSGPLLTQSHSSVGPDGHARDVLLANTPRSFLNLATQPTVKQEDLSAPEALVYEDDDGYSFMNLEPLESSNATQNIPNSSLLSTTIIEESESENGPFNDASTPLLSLGVHNCPLEEILHDSNTFSTGYSSAGSVFSPPAVSASTGASESKEQPSGELEIPVKRESPG